MANRCRVLAVTGLLLGMLMARTWASTNIVARPGLPYKIKVWDTEDRLPQNSVKAMTQTRDGYLWLGTFNGLARFDGIQFTVFDENNTPALNSSQIKRLAEDEQHNLWINTQNGAMAMMTGGQIVSPKDLRLMPFKPHRPDSLIREWSQQRLKRDLEPDSWKGAIVTDACEDRQGGLVVGTRGAGLFWFDSKGQVTSLSTNEGLSHSWILSLLVDREGTLWVGTDGGGLNRVKRNVFEVLEEAPGYVQSVCEDAKGGLWIVSESGLSHWRDGVLRRFGPDQNLPSSYNRAVFVDGKERVWVGALGAGLFQLQNDTFQWMRMAGTVQAFHQDARGRLWLGTQGGLISWNEGAWKPYSTHEGLSADGVRAIADDPEGNIWIGTEGGGLNRLRDERFTSFGKKDGLPSDQISSLRVDAEGVLWIGTPGGLARFHKGKWTRYTTREGLSSNSIGYLLDDGQGSLWMGSNVGLMRVTKKALNDFAEGLVASIFCRTYGKADGLPTAECSFGFQPSAWRGRDGTLWFPTIKGLVSVNPARLNPNTNPPPVVIESVLLEGQEQPLKTGSAPALTIPPGKERLDIHYASLNLASPERARFRYRLGGHETKWTEAGNTRVAGYSKLPPGTYRFQVAACNEDGVWNEAGSSLAFIVEPPFWKTWWFRIASAMALLGSISGVVHYLSTQRLQRQVVQLRQQEALEKERARIARDIHDQLGANLTQVALLGELVESDKDDPEEIEAHARQICQAARETTRTLDEIVWTVNPSNDTLEGLITYICKHTQEYLAVAGVRYRLDVPPQLPDVTVLPEVRHNVFLAAKEAVTNIVRHAKASSVCLRLRLNASSCSIEIEDDGRGPGAINSKEAATRNGLRNMQKRMTDIGGDFFIGPGAETGTLVRLTVSLDNPVATHDN